MRPALVSARLLGLAHMLVHGPAQVITYLYASSQASSLLQRLPSRGFADRHANTTDCEAWLSDLLRADCNTGCRTRSRMGVLQLTMRLPRRTKPVCIWIFRWWTPDGWSNRAEDEAALS